MTWNHVYKQVTHFLTTKAIWSITSRTDGMISNSHSFRKLSLLNCGSILVISAIVFAVSDWENTSPENWEIIENLLKTWKLYYLKLLLIQFIFVIIHMKTIQNQSVPSWSLS